MSTRERDLSIWQFASCTRKVAHPKKSDAKLAAKHLYRKSGEAVNVYQCYFCEQWHVGHSIKARQRYRLRKLGVLDQLVAYRVPEVAA